MKLADWNTTADGLPCLAGSTAQRRPPVLPWGAVAVGMPQPEGTVLLLGFAQLLTA